MWWTNQTTCTCIDSLICINAIAGNIVHCNRQLRFSTPTKWVKIRWSWDYYVSRHKTHMCIAHMFVSGILGPPIFFCFLQCTTCSIKRNGIFIIKMDIYIRFTFFKEPEARSKAPKTLFCHKQKVVKELMVSFFISTSIRKNNSIKARNHFWSMVVKTTIGDESKL